MTVQKGETFQKDVAFKATDDERRVATGGVLVPGKVDLQGDWLEPETIRELADDFMARMQNAEADGEVLSVPGVMHAVFPNDHVTLVENRVLESDQEIGGKEFPAGSWIQSWRFDDDELWSLVDDGIFSGYSIGGIEVKWEGPYAQGDLPDDVAVADGYPDDESVWQIVEGTIAEVSSVDIPAVPDAVMTSVKAAGFQTSEKNILERADDEEHFIELMTDRGRTEDEAQRTWDYMQRVAENGGDVHPADKSDGPLKRVGRAVMDAVSLGAEDGTKAATATDGGTTTSDGDTGKAGQTLSSRNRDSIMASIDAELDVLQDAGVDHGMTRFTDREDIAFTLGDHTAREWADPDEDEDELPGNFETAALNPTIETKDVTPEQADIAQDVLEEFVDAQGDASIEDFSEWLWNSQEDLDADELTAAQSALSEFLEEWRATELTVSDQFESWLEDQQTTTNMSDNPMDDAPEWAKAVYEQTEQNSKRIEDLAGDGKNADDDDDGDDDDDEDDDKSASDEPPEWAKTIKDQTEENAKAIQDLATASGQSQQLDTPTKTEEQAGDDRKFSGDWDKTFRLDGGAN